MIHKYASFQVFQCSPQKTSTLPDLRMLSPPKLVLGDVPPTGGGPPPSGVTPGREGQGFGIRPKGAEVRSGHLEKFREPGKSLPFFELFNGDIPIQTSIDRGFSIYVFKFPYNIPKMNMSISHTFPHSPWVSGVTNKILICDVY